jgi:hypothetical protein
MRKWLVAAVVLLVVSIPIAVLAVSGGPTPLDHQAYRARVNQSITTSSGVWTDIKGFSVGPVCAQGAVSVTVSVSVTGARAGFRVVIDDGAPLDPGPAYVKGSSDGTDSFSYTFATTAEPFEASDSHAFEVQWRRSAGGSTTLDHGSAVLLYHDPGTCV